MDARAENRDGARCRNDRARRRIDRSISLIRESEFRNGIEIDVGQSGLGDTPRITGVDGKRITIPEASIESQRSAPGARCLEIRVEDGDIAALVAKEAGTAVAGRGNRRRIGEVRRPVWCRRRSSYAGEQSLSVIEPGGIEG